MNISIYQSKFMPGISNGFWGQDRQHPPKPIRNTKHECRLLYTNVHPYMLFMKSMRMYYMVEAINIQIFSQDSPQTIHSYKYPPREYIFLQRKHWPGGIHITNYQCFPSVKIPRAIIIAIGQHSVAQGAALSLYYIERFSSNCELFFAHDLSAYLFYLQID